MGGQALDFRRGIRNCIWQPDHMPSDGILWIDLSTLDAGRLHGEKVS